LIGKGKEESGRRVKGDGGGKDSKLFHRGGFVRTAEKGKRSQRGREKRRTKGDKKKNEIFGRKEKKKSFYLTTSAVAGKKRNILGVSRGTGKRKLAAILRRGCYF